MLFSEGNMSISKIAEQAGVSVSTVSRVLNAGTNVNPDTYSKVMQVVEEVGYKLPEAGRKGRPRKSETGLVTGNIAVIFPYEGTVEQSPLTARLVHGFTQASEQLGMNVVIGQFSQDGVPPVLLKRVKTDGMIIRPGLIGEAVVTNFKYDIPSVWLFEQRPDVLPEKIDNVLPDNVRVGELTARHFHRRGVRKAVLIRPYTGQISSITRGRSFIDSCLRFGIEVCSEFEGPELGEIVAAVTAMDPMPEGIFITADMPGLYHGFLEKGIRAEKEFELVFCDIDRAYLPLVNDKVVSVDMRFEEMARASLETLLWRLNNPASPGRRVMIEPAID
jgi:LacI family transcriptional regulator, repressor for deo operon, udp, cdd, tsx, nupC, and nupG